MAINYNAAIPLNMFLQKRAGSISLTTQQNLTQLIKSLFANNEVGFAYDPNDLTTLYQDAAGTIPVTAAGQPVGLMLDKSKGLVLGSELVDDPSFNNPAQWNVGTGVSVTGGNVVFSSVSSGNGIFRSGGVVTGRTYKVVVNVSSISSGGLYVLMGRGIGSLSSPSITTAGVYNFILTSLGSVPEFRINAAASATTAVISEVSVRELAGNHAYQTTSSMRPLLQNSPRKIDYDGVDDKLITNLPAQLTGCTVARSIPNIGTQILTNQTIPTPYNDSTDHCGLIVINRALTTAETAQITQLFNKAAGV